MLLINRKNIKNIICISFAVLIFTSCASKSTYSFNENYSNTSSKYSNKNNKKVYYRKIAKEKIRNSKAMHRATMRPYKIAGKWYHPSLAKVGDVLNGIASWYGPNFHAKKTSNGEVYNMYALTAAHKTLPMNTIVKVINLDNNKSIIVRVNDRGPFVSGRIIDLSNKAAHAVDMVKKGTARVKVIILGFNATIANTKSERAEIKKSENFFLQVGAFSKYKGALNVKRKFNLILENNYQAIIKRSSNINRVWIKGFKSLEEAEDFKMNNDLNSSVIIAQ